MNILFGKERRKKRTRLQLDTTNIGYRISVYRSNKHIYIQLIDDKKNHTVTADSDIKIEKEKLTKSDKAKQIAISFAKKMKDKKITKAVFDRGSYKYHGRVKIIAETLRSEGIVI